MCLLELQNANSRGSSHILRHITAVHLRFLTKRSTFAATHMLYFALHYLVRWALMVYFRRLHFIHRDRLPDGKPVVLAVNHTNAFMDPILLGSFLPRDFHYVTRGDIFGKHKVIDYLLAALHMLPIYRFRNGIKNLRKNQQSLEIIYNLLDRNRKVAVFAEGNCVMKKRLRPLQKGAARMALEAAERQGFSRGLVVVPIGINYSHYHRFRKTVTLRFGRPIAVADYRATYKQNAPLAIRQLTDQIEQQLDKQVISIRREEDTLLTEQLFILDRNSLTYSVFPVVSSSNARYASEKRIAERVYSMDAETRTELSGMTSRYFDRLAEHDLQDYTLVQDTAVNTLTSSFVVIGFLPYWVGRILNAPPLLLADTIANKYVKGSDFFDSVRVASGLVCYLVYLGLFIVPALLHSWWWLLAWLILPTLGYFSLVYHDIVDRWRAFRRYHRVQEAQPELIADLQEKRAEILEDVFYE